MGHGTSLHAVANALASRNGREGRPINADSLPRAWQQTLANRADLNLSVESVANAVQRALDSFGPSPDFALPTAKLEALPFDDMLVAAACAQGCPRAIRELDERALPNALEGARSLERSGVHLDDVAQRLREIMLVASDTQPPRIGLYAGRGSLVGFLRVAAVRVALNLRRDAKPGRETSLDEMTEGLMLASHAPDEAAFREDARTHVKRALSKAIERLEGEEREALRLHLLEESSIDDLAIVFGVHRSTAARWLGRARDAIFAAMLDELRRELGWTRTDCESAARAVLSQVELSLERLLGPDSRPG